jgi:hypothetical protein
MKCKFRKWGSLSNKGELLHSWYCKVHKAGGRYTDEELYRTEMKAHKKEAKHNARP